MIFCCIFSWRKCWAWWSISLQVVVYSEMFLALLCLFPFDALNSWNLFSIMAFLSLVYINREAWLASWFLLAFSVGENVELGDQFPYRVVEYSVRFPALICLFSSWHVKFLKFVPTLRHFCHLYILIERPGWRADFFLHFQLERMMRLVINFLTGL